MSGNGNGNGNGNGEGNGGVRGSGIRSGYGGRRPCGRAGGAPRRCGDATRGPLRRCSR